MIDEVELKIRPGERDPTAVATSFVSEARVLLAQLVAMCQPYRLPDAYMFFLEYCGGLAVINANSPHIFALHGLGPANNIWYAPVVEPIVNYAVRQLQIADWDLDRSDQALIAKFSKALFPDVSAADYSTSGMVAFHLDVAGDVQKDSILVDKTAHSGQRSFPRVSGSLTDQIYSDHLARMALNTEDVSWLKVSDSFTDWLEKLALVFSPED